MCWNACRCTTPTYDRHSRFENADRPFGALRALFLTMLWSFWIMSCDSHSSFSYCLRNRSLKQGSHEHVSFQTGIIPRLLVARLLILFCASCCLYNSREFSHQLTVLIHRCLLPPNGCWMLLWERRKTASTAKVFLILFFFMHAPRVSYVILILLCMHVSSVSCCFVCMFRAILSDHLLQTLTSSGKNVIVTTWLSRFNKMSTDGKTPRLDPVGSYRHLLRAVNETLYHTLWIFNFETRHSSYRFTDIVTKLVGILNIVTKIAGITDTAT